MTKVYYFGELIGEFDLNSCKQETRQIDEESSKEMIGAVMERLETAVTGGLKVNFF